MSLFKGFITLSLALITLACTAQTVNAAITIKDKQQIYQILQTGTHDAVLALERGEREILLGLLALDAGKTKEAIVTLSSEELTSNRLAALIRAEAYRRQSVQAADRAGNYAHGISGDISKLKQAKLSEGINEAKQHLIAFVSKLNNKFSDKIILPFDLLELGSKVLNVIVVDKTKSQLSLYKNSKGGKLKKLAAEKVVIDTNTPSGIYRVSSKRTAEQLSPYYGDAAFTINYPNQFDQIIGAKSNDIYIHSGLEAGGGIALTDQAFANVAKHIATKQSWVVVGNNMHLDAEFEKMSLRSSARGAIEQWRKDWESRSADAYLSHYHAKFRTAEHNINSWSKYKRRVNGRKSYINVTLSDFTIIRSPKTSEFGEAVLVEFYQKYRSSNYKANSRKILYLVRSNETWKIIFEGDLSQSVSAKQKIQPTVSRAAVQAKPESKVEKSSAQIAVNRGILNEKPVTVAKVAEAVNPIAADRKTIPAFTVTSGWAVNLGSFDSMMNAEQMADSIDTGDSPFLPYVSIGSVNDRQVYRVRVGLFADKADAINTMLEICPALGLTDCWIVRTRRK